MMRYSLLVVALIFLSCEERIETSLHSQETGLLVVDGLITNERKNHVVQLSLPSREQNAERQPASGASVYLFEDSTLSVLTEFPMGSGNYYTPIMRGLFGKRYTLFIRYGGRQYFAQDSPVPVQPLNELHYTQTNNGYTLALNEQPGDPYYIEYGISWQTTEDCVDGLPCEGHVFFYDLKTVDVNELYKPDEEPFYFPEGSVVIRRKYSVSAVYKTFLRSMLSETRWRGGAFDVQRSNVVTNLSEGAIGFFAVCTVVSDTTIIE